MSAKKVQEPACMLPLYADIVLYCYRRIKKLETTNFHVRALVPFFFSLLVLVMALHAGCKTTPVQVPPDDPGATLHFTSIEVQDTSKIFLNYKLLVTNPDHADVDFCIEAWNAVINEKNIKTGLTFAADNVTGNYDFSVASGTKEIIVRLELDIPSLIAEGVPLKDDFFVDLKLDILRLHSPVLIQARETAVFPFIREPVFTITKIAILKADLVNTRFKVTINIDNPNNYQVDLSSFEYELYGNGLLWAEGRERNIINVPPRSSFQGDLFLTMNFINMKRDLLDQIIRLEDVNYRFNGKAFVSTEVAYLPRFRTDFNLSGYSRVLDADS